MTPLFVDSAYVIALINERDQYHKQMDDKQWGLVDCISFVVMRERGIDEALTADHHFVQAGFRALFSA